MKKLFTTTLLLIGFVANLAAAKPAGEAIANLQNASTAPTAIHYDEALGTPQMVTGKFAMSRSLSDKEAAKQFVNQNRNAFGIPSKHEIVVTSAAVQANESVVRLSQKIDGIAIFGSDIAVSVNNNNEVTAVAGKIFDLDVNTIPRLGAQEAVRTTLNELNGLNLNGQPTVDLNVYVLNGAGVLTWHVVAKTQNPEGQWHYFVDAQNGKITSKFNNIHEARNRKTYNGNQTTTLPGTLVLQETTGSTTDAVINTIHNNTAIVYNYYWNKLGRDSYDGAGAVLTSTAHHDRNYVNAYWNGTQMVYGDGDGTQSGPLGNALDVVGHELTHAVTERTSGLVYQNQSGALNESMSDIFGTLIEWYNEPTTWDWKVGEDCWTPATAGDALRYMDNPGLGQQPDKMSSSYYYTGTGDNGGVHYNSGVPNHAFYRAVATYGLSMEDGGKIFYRAQTNYLTSSSDFQAARTATVQAATDLFGAGSAQVTAVGNGWTYVEVMGPPADFTGTFAAGAYATPNPYANSATYTKTFTSPGATGMKVHFTAFNTESGYDFVKIKDAAGVVIYSYSGNKGAFTSGPVNGASITVTMTSDGSVNASGFSIDGYYYNGGTPPANQAPTAKANGPYSSATGAAIAFSSAGSTDADGTIASYNWNFGDGTTSTTANPSKTYSAAGTYTVTLTVTDNAGATGTNSATATITTTPPTTYITAESEANNAYTSANGPCGNNVNVAGNISTTTDADFYHFTLNTTGTITISVTIATTGKDLDWALYKSSAPTTTVKTSTTTSNPETSSYSATTTGKYYLKVYGYSGAMSGYTLKITGSNMAIGAGDAGEVIAAKSFEVMNAYPNPFTKSTTIAYSLPANGNVSVKVYNTVGQLVKTLVSEDQAAGQHNIVWDGRTDNGSEVAAGVYFYQIVNGKHQDMKRVTMSK